MEPQFQLSEVVEHQFLDDTGYVVARAEHLTGCTRYAVRPKSGSFVSDDEWVYEGEITSTGEYTIFDDEPVTECDVVLGNTVVDELTGLEGWVTTITYEAWNCPRVAITPSDDPQADREWVDVPRVTVTGGGKHEQFSDEINNDTESETGPVGADLSRKSDRA